jgi:uncharacterized protein
MTALPLLASICGALLLQVAIAIGATVARHRRLPTADPPADAASDEAPPPAGAWPGWRAFRIASRTFEDSSHAQCSFRLLPVDGLPLPPFAPGQYLTVRLELADPQRAGAARTVVRCYSMSAPSTATGYRITVKRVPPPAALPDVPPGAASTHLIDAMHVGDCLDVRAPAGRFALDPDPTASLVLVGGGIGITPLLCMLHAWAATQPARAMHLFYGVRNGGEHAFRQELAALAAGHPDLSPIVAYSAPLPDDVAGRDFQHDGRLDIALIRRTLPAGSHRFHLCGPAAMMETLVPALQATGARAEDIHHESFGPASVRFAGGSGPGDDVPAPDAIFDVRFLRAGRTLAWERAEGSLLDLAERRGLAMDAGCRTGSCGSCETRLVSGTVGYARAPDHVCRAGDCLPCVAFPTSAIVLDA